MTTKRNPTDTKLLHQMYLVEQLSIPDIARRTEQTYSATRAALLAAGIPLRTRADGIRLATPKIAKKLTGKPRSFSEEHRGNIRRARIHWGDEHAAGISQKANGYTEITRGPNKGRSLHVVLAEERLGRPLRADEVVHHKDGNPRNNHIDNLQVMTRAAHTAHHRKDKKHGLR